MNNCRRLVGRNNNSKIRFCSLEVKLYHMPYHAKNTHPFFNGPRDTGLSTNTSEHKIYNCSLK